MEEMNFWKRINQKLNNSQEMVVNNSQEMAVFITILPPETAVTGIEMITKGTISEIAFQNCL